MHGGGAGPPPPCALLINELLHTRRLLMRLIIQETFFYCSAWVLFFLLFTASKGIGQILTYFHFTEGLISVLQFSLIVFGYVVLGLWLYDMKFRLFKE